MKAHTCLSFSVQLLRKTTMIGALVIGLGAIFTASNTADAYTFSDGEYKLKNTEHGDWGLKINELYNVRRYKTDVFTFDFNDYRSDVRLTVSDQGTKVKISGDVYGGWEKNGRYRNGHSGVFTLDFAYKTKKKWLDDDLGTPWYNAGKNGGTVSIGRYEWDFVDYAGGNWYSLNLGDGFKDKGPNLGTGWLAKKGWKNKHAGDWKFVAHAVPEPVTATLAAMGLFALGLSTRRRRAA